MPADAGPGRPDDVQDRRAHPADGHGRSRPPGREGCRQVAVLAHRQQRRVLVPRPRDPGRRLATRMPRCPADSTVSEPSIRRSTRATSPGRSDSGISASWVSKTTPAAPPRTQAPAVRGPMPPAAQTGTVTSRSATSCCSRTNVLRSLTRPPDSMPRAITPCAPLPTAARASAWLVTSTRTRAQAAVSATSHGPSAASTTSPGFPPAQRRTSSGLAWQPAGTRTPTGAADQETAWASARIGRQPPSARSSTPWPPPCPAAAATRGLGSSAPTGLIAITKSRKVVSGAIKKPRSELSRHEHDRDTRKDSIKDRAGRVAWSVR